MNNPVHSDLLLPSGEITADHGESDLADQSRIDLDGICLMLRHVFKLPDSSIGLLSCIAEVLRDLKLALGIDSGAREWVDALTLCKKQIEESTRLSEAKDRSLLQGIGSWPTRMLLTPITSQLPPDDRHQIRLIRAKAVLNHISNREPFSDRFCQIFAGLCAAKNDIAKELGQAICNDRTKLIEVRKRFQPDSENYAFLSSLINCVDTPVKPPLKIRAQQISPIVAKGNITEDVKDDNESSDDTQEPLTSSQVGESKPKHSGAPSEENDANENDHIGNFILELKYSRPRDFSGIHNLWDYLQPSELEYACKQFLLGLNGPNDPNALAALISVFTRLRPKAFGSLPLASGKSASMWLDLDSGHLCWQLEAAIDRKRWLLRDEKWVGRPPLRIPLPSELTERLANLLKIFPNAQSLGDLFGGHLSALEKSTREYLKSISPTSHRVTLGRLCSSHARYLLNQCKDEAYACVLGLDFRLGTVANINYCTFKASRINEITKDAYLKLGLSGAVNVPLDADAGSRFIGKIEAIDKIIKESLNDALAVFSHVIDRHDSASLTAAHNTISQSILRVLCITTQHRESLNYSFAHHTLCLEQRLALISDKDISAYLSTRITPIPELVSEWLKFYLKWLELLRYRFLKLDRSISKLADSILASRDIRADGPLFFQINQNGAATPLRNEDISSLFKRFGLEGNAGRHWVDNILRDAGLDSSIAMVCAGHASNGQEAYGVRSALDPMLVCDTARQALDKHLQKLNLPLPPKLKARKCPVKFKHEHSFTPGGFCATPSDVPPVDQIWESCPFKEFTLAHARQFKDICRRWHSTAQSPSLGTVAISLVFRDGIANRSELLAGVKELLSGRIYQNKKEFFIDTNSRELGIRRTWLDSVTFRLASKFKLEQCSDEEILAQIQSAFLKVAEPWGVPVVSCPINEVLKRPRAFYSLHLPGVLRGWMFGEVHARTLRQEAVARHAFDTVEHPSVEGGRSHRSSHIGGLDAFITDAISDASDKTEYKGREETRIRDLVRKLSEFENIPLNSGVLEVLIKYALYLARNLKDPSSVNRYYSGLKAFIVENCSSLDSLDDFSEIEWSEPVVKFRDLRVAATGKDFDPERTALNHFMNCFEVDRVLLQSFDPAVSARRYADYPSLKEAARTHQIIQEISSLPESRTSQAQIAFDVLFKMYLRWSDVSRLRVADIGRYEPTSIVFTHEAIGTHKTNNADRVHTGTEQKISDSLSTLCQFRLKQFPAHNAAFLFCNRENSKSISQANEIHNLITDALWSASGSSFLCVHSGRRTLPTMLVESILYPESRNNLSPLYLRQALYFLAASIGHSDPLTTFANYICNLDTARRKWVDSIFRKVGIKASPSFVASITDIPVDTIRARSRRASPLAQTDFLEGFDPDDNVEFQSCLRPLDEFLVTNTTRLAIDPRKTSKNEALSCAAYTAARLLNTEKELAAFISQISNTNQEIVDHGLRSIHKALGRTFNSDLLVSPTQLLTNEIFVSASKSFSQFNPGIETSLALCRLIAKPDKAWQVFNNDDIPILSNILQYLDESEIETIITRNKSGKLNADNFITFPSSKFCHRQINSRNFPRDCKLRIQFVPVGTSLSALTSKTSLTTFIVGAVAISRFAITMGKNHE